MARTKDYYQVLGVTPRSHPRMIEESYCERAHGLHGVPTRKAQQRLGVLTEAYEVPGTPHKRPAYDRRRRDDETASDRARGGLFEAVLGILGKPFRPD